MCGIAGIVSFGGIDQSKINALKKMITSLTHRGPDGEGVYTNLNICFGHRRLSILDIENGAQPFTLNNEMIILTYNGEIYNFREIRDELSSLGYRFVTDCDTEVLISAWKEWGTDSIEKFRGMFSFAIWDEEEKSCYLVRDRLGIKPLYYSIDSSGNLLFGSELKSLLVSEKVNKEFDKTAIDDYFSLGYVPDPKCIYKNIYKLEAGCFMRFREFNSLEISRYWDLQRNDRADQDPYSDDLLRELLEDAVKSRMVSDVPLGAFLSGGVDSSAVASLMANINEKPINTCSIGFTENSFDETLYAEKVAERISSNHNKQKVSLLDVDLIDTLSKVYDEPFADSSALPTYKLCQLARKKVIVALSGDGGDEVFAGYTRYKWHMKEESIRRLIPIFIRKPLFSLAALLYPKMSFAPKWLRLKSTFFALSKSSVEGYYNNISILPEGSRQKIYSESMVNSLGDYSPLNIFTKYGEEAKTKDALWKIQYIDLKTYLVGDILTKVDRASMAHSLEVRVPMIDHKLLGWAANLPQNQRMIGDEGKLLLKKSMQPLVDDEILYRKKMGFGVPVSQWFKGELKEKVESLRHSVFLNRCGLFNMDYIGELSENHLAGFHDNGAALWSLFMFEAFLKNVHYESK